MKFLKAVTADALDYVRVAREGRRPHPSVVLVTGAPRSGTTWFGAMLHHEKSLLYHEPFKARSGLWGDGGGNAPNENDDAFRQVYAGIVEGREWRSYHRPTSSGKMVALNFGRLHHRVTPGGHDIVIKDPCISYYLDFFKTLGFSKIVAIYRNPLSVVASLKTLGWSTTARLHKMKRHAYVHSHLPTHVAAYLERLDDYSAVECMAIHTAILHRLMSDSREGVIEVEFEDYAEQPVEMFRALFSTLGIDYSDRVKANHLRLTRGASGKGASGKHAKHEVARRSSEETEKYKRILTAAEIASCGAIYTDILGERSRYDLQD